MIAALEQRFTMLVSVPLMLEYEAVLTRSDQLSTSGLTAKETGAVLDALAAVIEPVPLRFLWRPQLKDPADEMVLETAVNGRADCLVTFNVRHFQAASEFGLRLASSKEIWLEIKRDKYETK